MLAVGVTVMVPEIPLAPVFVPLKPGMLLLPLAPSPIPVFELVHAKVVPVTELVKLVAAIALPLQTVMLEGTVTSGVGFTVMV